MNYFILAAEFFKTGLFSIGGGLATLPFVVRLAERVNWLMPEEVPAMLAVVQMLPGGIGVNLAAYTGLHVSLAGAYIAVLALVSPQILCITLIARALNRFDNSAAAQRIFTGLLPAAAGLLGAVSFDIFKQSVTAPREALLCGALFILLRLFPRLPAALFIAIAAAAGIFFGL